MLLHDSTPKTNRGAKASARWHVVSVCFAAIADAITTIASLGCPDQTEPGMRLVGARKNDKL